MQGRVAVIERGTVTFVEKVRVAQAAGAVAAIIVDRSFSCPEGLRCAQSYFNAESGAPLPAFAASGFASHDDSSKWADIFIPSVLVAAASGARLRSLMALELIHVHGIPSAQLVSLHGQGGLREAIDDHPSGDGAADDSPEGEVLETQFVPDWLLTQWPDGVHPSMYDQMDG